jgi:hypothetical protein
LLRRTRDFQMSDAEQAWNDVASLWEAVFGEAPPVHCEPGMLLDVLVGNLAVTLPYQPGTNRGSMEIARAGQDAHVSGMTMALDRRPDGFGHGVVGVGRGGAGPVGGEIGGRQGEVRQGEQVG